MKGAELEGHAYLGLGMLVLLPIALLTLIAPGSARPNVKPYVPLIAVGLLLWMLAVSHLVAWGDRVVLEIPIRGKLLDTIATLRASGRLAWVALYGLWFAAVAIVATRFKPRVATALIVGAVALQFADISPRYVSMRDYFADRFIATPAKRASPLVSPFWPEAAKHYRTIRMAPVANMARGWEWLSLYAVDHGMAINTGQFARLSFPRVDAANGVITRTLKDGPLDPSTLYLLWSRDAKFDWTIGPDDGVGVFDGYFVVAPGWFAEARGSIAPEYLVRGPRRGIAP
jgi:hypothetical protein